MRTVAQCHERQQSPVVLGGGVATIFDPEPLLDFGPPRMVEVDNAHQRGECRQRSWARPVGWRWRDRHVVQWEGEGLETWDVVDFVPLAETKRACAVSLLYKFCHEYSNGYAD